MVLSLKVDGKNYLPIKQIQRCENINQLMWMLLISVTIAAGIFFVYMMFYTYKNAEESQFEITKIKYGSIPEIIFFNIINSRLVAVFSKSKQYLYYDNNC